MHNWCFFCIFYCLCYEKGIYNCEWKDCRSSIGKESLGSLFSLMLDCIQCIHLKKISQHSVPWVKCILITYGMKQRRHLSTLMYPLYRVNTKQPFFFIAAPTTYMNRDPNVPQGARARSAGSRPEQPVMGNGCTMCVCCVVSVSLHHR